MYSKPYSICLRGAMGFRVQQLFAIFSRALQDFSMGPGLRQKTSDSHS